MRLAALTIIVCLLLGAIINVVVAWGFVLWTPMLPVIGTVEDPWLADVPGNWPPAGEMGKAQNAGLTFSLQRGDNVDSTVATLLRNFEAETYQAQSIADQAERGAALTREVIRYNRFRLETHYLIARVGVLRSGWPVRSMFTQHRSLETHTFFARPVVADTSGSNPGLGIPAWIPWSAPAHQESRRIPTRIIPLGFAVNTLFYGSLITLVVWVWARLRRRYRVSEGCCTACGYDLRGAAHERCPECGASLTLPAATAVISMTGADT